MERLTLSDYGRFKIPPPAGTKEKERPSYMDLYCRLAAIEDIQVAAMCQKFLDMEGAK